MIGSTGQTERYGEGRSYGWRMGGVYMLVWWGRSRELMDRAILVSHKILFDL